MNEQFLSALQAENLPVSLDESLGRHTTFRIGGNADFFCVPATVTQLTRILELCRQYQVRTYLLGKGLDSVMNYPFKNAVLDFVKGKPAEQAMGEILSICEHYPAPAMDCSLVVTMPPSMTSTVSGMVFLKAAY